MAECPTFISNPTVRDNNNYTAKIDGKIVGTYTSSTQVSKIALAAGAASAISPYLDYVQVNNLRVRKYTSLEPTATLSPEHPNDYGLVAEWHFDEGSGNVTADSSGNGNDGTIYGATGTTGVSGTALEFDGVDDYAESSLNSTLNSNLTIELWMKSKYQSSNQEDQRRILDLGTSGSRGFQLCLSPEGTLLIDNTGGPDSEAHTSKSYNDGNWHHIVGVREGSNYHLYVDGLYKNSTSGTIPSYNYVYIAKIAENWGYFNGTTDEVRIYNRALTATEIKTHYEEKKPTGLVAEWHFDEGSGNVTEDSSGNENDGTIYGATWTTGISGEALEFDGVDDYVEISNEENFDFSVSDPFTLMAWVKTIESSYYALYLGNIIGKYDYVKNYNRGYCFGAYRPADEKNVVPAFGIHKDWANYKFRYGNTDASDGNWHLFVATYDGSNTLAGIKLYVDGTEESYNVIEKGTVSTMLNNEKLLIGTRTIGSCHFNGSIDEIRIYNRALTATEIKTHYEEIKPAEEIATEQKIVFTSDRSGNSDIWMMDPDGTNLEQLTTDTSSDTTPQISPDGTKIAFLSDRTGTWQVWLMNTDGSNHYQLFDVNELPITYEYEKRVNYPTWAPDGSYLITHIELVGEVHSAPWAAIYRHDPDGTNPQLFLDWGPSINGKFSISRDGRTFAYCREDSSYWTPTLKISVGNIVESVVDETSINNLNVTIDGQVDEDVVWFSNGNKLMWSKSSNSEGYGIPQNLYSMNIDETDTKKLTTFTDKYARMPDFAPDEQKVAFTVSNETTADIYIMNANGSGVQALLVDDYKNSGPCWGSVVVSSLVLFDTGEGTYPSISGIHNGTIKPSHNFSVNGMYTYPCAGTGGHTETLELYEGGILIANGTWNGYSEDNQNVTIHNVTGASYVTLLKGHEYNYTIKTGSYPQIIHKQSHITLDGSVITCTEFIDVNGKRYDDWIPAIAFTPADAVLILNFDEGSGTIAKDESGYGNDGTIYGAKWVEGKYGKALEFDGVDDYIEIADSASLNFGTSSFSVSVWVKSNEVSKAHDIITKSQRSGIVTPKRWRIGQNPNSDVFFDIDDDTKPAATPHSTAVNIADGSWHQIVAVRKAGTGTELFIDGVLKDSDDDRGDISNTEQVYIGCKSDKGFFNGIIDEIQVYRRALTVDEIKELYER